MFLQFLFFDIDQRRDIVFNGFVLMDEGCDTVFSKKHVNERHFFEKLQNGYCKHLLNMYISLYGTSSIK